MKMPIRLIILLFVGFSSFGQETLIKIRKDTSSQMRTLFKPAKLKSVGLSLQSQIQVGKRGPEYGLGFQVHLNNKLSLGIASFNSMPNRNDRNNGMAPEPRQRFTALTLEATPMANKVFHLSFPLAIGRIQEELISVNVYDPALNPTTPTMGITPPNPQFGGPRGGGNDPYFNGPHTLGIQPGINVEVNLLKHWKVFGGANYRFAFGEEKTPGMSRAAATFGVKVGVFDKRIRGANAR